MWFRFKCLQKVLFHRASERLGRNETPSRHKHENYSISRYLEAAERLDIGVSPLGFGVYELRRGEITKRLMSNLCVDGENLVTYKLCGNKYLTYKVLLNNGIRYVPRHQLYTYRDVDKTCRDFVAWQCPVVIKPCRGTAGGTGVTVNITTIKELKNAICESFLFDRSAYLMEQFIEGSHFRLVTLRGEVVACVQRMPARIVGNGKDSVKALIHKENQRRQSDRSEIPLYPIVVDNEVRRKLRSMRKSMATVLAQDEELYVRDTINFHAGGELRCLDHVGDDIRHVCRDASAALGLYLGGFDIITHDITKPLEETNGVINEVNTSPGMEYMYHMIPDGVPVHVTQLVLCDLFNLCDVPCALR